jgi:shikimate kinase
VVFACGGGAILNSENRKILAKNSLVIWLYLTPVSCFSRLDFSKRPLLHKKDPIKVTESLMATRKVHYFQTADIIINGEKKPEEVVNKIKNEIDQTFRN